MQTLFKIALVAVAVVAGIYFAYTWAFPTHTFRYRLTVAVDVDGDTKTGSSVIEVDVKEQSKFGSAPPFVARARGSGVFVDLGRDWNLIAGLAYGSGAGPDFPQRVFPAAHHTDFAGVKQFTTVGESRDVPASQLPLFLALSRDGSQIKIVRPDEFSDVFGQGVSLRGVTVELTSNEVTASEIPRVPALEKFFSKQKEVQLVRPGDLLLGTGSGIFERNQ